MELVDLVNGKSYPLGHGDFLVGRSVDATLPVLDLGCSRAQFRIRSSADRWMLEALSATTPTYCDGVRVEAQVELHGGMEIRASRSRFQVRDGVDARRLAGASPPAVAGMRAASGPSPAPVESAEPGEGRTMLGVSPLAGGSAPLPKRIELTGDTVIGRDAAADIQLDHVQVSCRHARIRTLSGKTVIQDLGSTNGTFVDGRRILMPELLAPGSRVGIGPFSLTFTGSSLVPVSRSNNLQLEGRELTRRVPCEHADDGLKTILDRVSIAIRPHEFVCLLGPTGSGKSTLLSALSARMPADSGCVLINQTDLYRDFESLKQDIAVVPQRDFIHELLTLEQVLTFTARLRLPRDSTPDEIRNRIDYLLGAVDLGHCRATLVGQLSGGQRRRAGLANELISNPGLLFLDEVTSGLDEQTDREMMRLFRSVADSGKTVVCVTHTLANIAETCHLVVLLTVGGKLAFVGTPTEALEYFEIPHLGHVYEKLEKPDLAEHWQQRFLESEYYARYVTGRLSPGETLQDAGDHGIERYWRNQAAMLRHQLPVLTARYWRVFTADRRSMVGLALQCLIVAVVLYLVFGDVGAASDTFRRAALSTNVLFVLAVSCFWFGCNNSAKEIVKERAVYTKELQVNLDPGSYYASKFVLQLLVAAAQSLALLVIVSPWCGLPGSLASQAALLILAAAAGVAVGLFLSCVSITEEMALTLVPLVLIPQIILCDVFVELDGVSQLLGRGLVSNYWVFGALRGTLPETLVEQLNAPLARPLPAATAAVAAGMHIGALVALSVFTIHVRDRVMATSKKTFHEAVRDIRLFRAMWGALVRG